MMVTEVIMCPYKAHEITMHSALGTRMSLPLWCWRIKIHIENKSISGTTGSHRGSEQRRDLFLVTLGEE